MHLNISVYKLFHKWSAQGRKKLWNCIVHAKGIYKEETCRNGRWLPTELTLERSGGKLGMSSLHD